MIKTPQEIAEEITRTWVRVDSADVSVDRLRALIAKAIREEREQAELAAKAAKEFTDGYLGAALHVAAQRTRGIQ